MAESWESVMERMSVKRTTKTPWFAPPALSCCTESYSSLNPRPTPEPSDAKVTSMREALNSIGAGAAPP
eukprot:2550499-Rhodomonas_salina.1